MKKYHQAHICFSEKSDYEAYMKEIKRFRKVSKALGQDWKKALTQLLKEFNDRNEKPELLRPKLQS